MTATRRERRRHVRRSSRMLPGWTAARLRPGRAVDLVDWSERGALVETAARITPGRPVVMVVEGPAGGISIAGRVLRVGVSALGPPTGVRYRAALRFETAVDLGQMTQARGVVATRGPLGNQAPTGRSGRRYPAARGPAPAGDGSGHTGGHSRHRRGGGIDVD